MTAAAASAASGREPIGVPTASRKSRSRRVPRRRSTATRRPASSTSRPARAAAKFAGRLCGRDRRGVRQARWAWASTGSRPTLSGPHHPQGPAFAVERGRRRQRVGHGRARAGRTPGLRHLGRGHDGHEPERRRHGFRPSTSTATPSTPATATRSRAKFHEADIAHRQQRRPSCHGARLPERQLLGGSGRRQHQLLLRQRLPASAWAAPSARTRARTSTTATC